MATDQVTGLAGGATGTPLAGITGTLQGTANRILQSRQNLLDKIISPEQREEMKSKIARFSTERPLLASFLLSQIALSGLPLALFLIMTITVGVFAILTGLLVGLIGALLFIVSALVVALFVLLPTLFITTFFAVAIWLWAVGAYYIIKWFNEKKVPGIHVPLGQGLMEQTGLKKLPAISGAKSSTSTSTTTAASESNGSVEKEKSSPNPEAKRAQEDEGQRSSSLSQGGKQDRHMDGDGRQTRKKPVEKTETKHSSSLMPAGDTVTDAPATVGNAGKHLIV